MNNKVTVSFALGFLLVATVTGFQNCSQASYIKTTSPQNAASGLVGSSDVSNPNGSSIPAIPAVSTVGKSATPYIKLDGLNVASGSYAGRLNVGYARNSPASVNGALYCPTSGAGGQAGVGTGVEELLQEVPWMRTDSQGAPIGLILAIEANLVKTNTIQLSLEKVAGTCGFSSQTQTLNVALSAGSPTKVANLQADLSQIFGAATSQADWDANYVGCLFRLKVSAQSSNQAHLGSSLFLLPSNGYGDSAAFDPASVQYQCGN